jgi:hypothetical protein
LWMACDLSKILAITTFSKKFHAHILSKAFHI